MHRKLSTIISGMMKTVIKRIMIIFSYKSTDSEYSLNMHCLVEDLFLDCFDRVTHFKHILQSHFTLM